MIKIRNFTTIESEYGPFIVNRHCAYQADVLIKTGKPHIQVELQKILAIANSLPNDSVCIDAGANIGLVSIPLAQFVSSKNGVVYAYEPQRLMSYALCGAAALNDLENLLVFNQALGAEKGSLGAEKIDYAKPQDFGLFSLVDQSKAPETTIDVITIDSLGLKRLDFLKVDVEGMEVEVLEGAKKSINLHLPWCWIEVWKVGVENIKAQFRDLDYVFFMMDDLNMLCAPKKKLEQSSLKINAKEI